MRTKLIKLQELIEKYCKDTPKLNSKIIGVVGRHGNRIKFPEDIEVILECGNK